MHQQKYYNVLHEYCSGDRAMIDMDWNIQFAFIITFSIFIFFFEKWIESTVEFEKKKSEISLIRIMDTYLLGIPLHTCAEQKTENEKKEANRKSK